MEQHRIIAFGGETKFFHNIPRESFRGRLFVGLTDLCWAVEGNGLFDGSRYFRYQSSFVQGSYLKLVTGAASRKQAEN